MLLLVGHALRMASHTESSLDSPNTVIIIKHAQLQAKRDQ